MHYIRTTAWLVFNLISLLVFSNAAAQVLEKTTGSLVIITRSVKITMNCNDGKISYLFTNGNTLNNTVAYINEVHSGYITSADFTRHTYTVDHRKDKLGKVTIVHITHEDDQRSFRFIQHITCYENNPYLLISAEAKNKNNPGRLLETRNICPLAILPSQQGKLSVTGNEPRILDMPFDNDNWVNVLERNWAEKKGEKLEGSSYEFSAVYDQANMSGFVVGSLSHDFWKTGISYKTGFVKGTIDSLVVFGGIATADNPALPADYGGYDGTHDHAPHGSMAGSSVSSPLIYLDGSDDIRKAFVRYGKVNAAMAGSLKWKGCAPFYWNSFGVEDVLGYRNVMLPPSIEKISDFIHTLDNFNGYAKPVISIDSYDQGIYSTDVLTAVGKYAESKNQQIGFYFIPFAIWTWKNGMAQNKLPGSEYSLNDVLLRDNDNQPIAYKNGDWGAFPIDPTHPATRLYIINQLQKAKAIHATFIKIDFLTAGSLESSVRYDASVRSGMQAYNGGMKMLKSLVDSILGPDIFITMAISPMFPHQYAHTRFVSTDVYSHLRNDQPGFPNWGSTEASLSTGSHLWWVQGTLWPYINLDISIMKNFQKNADLTEQDIKVRMYAMIAMGSILGDGSDYRNEIAAERARYFLNNKYVCAFFSNPKVFTPLKFSDGETMNQQISFHLAADTAMLAMFNFDTAKVFSETFNCKTLGLKNKKYVLHDFLTDAVLGEIEKDKEDFKLTITNKDALMIRIVPANE
jgi:alpha-galactosidase